MIARLDRHEPPENEHWQLGRAALIGVLTMNKPTEYWIPLEASTGLLVLLGEGLEPSVEWHRWDEPILPDGWLDVI